MAVKVSANPLQTLCKPSANPQQSRKTEDQKTGVGRQKSGSPVITISVSRCVVSVSRSVGIPADEAASVVAGLVPATNRLAIVMV